MKYEILQLLPHRPDGTLIPYKYQSYEWAKTCTNGKEPSPDDYISVYDGESAVEDEAVALDAIFFLFRENPFADFHGHTLTVSDVVVFPESWHSYYRNPKGWCKLPKEFFKGFLGCTKLHEYCRCENTAKVLAPRIVGSICNRNCTSPYKCGHEHAGETSSNEEKCPLMHYSVYQVQNIPRRTITPKEALNVCGDCKYSRLIMEQGTLMLDFLNRQTCKNCPSGIHWAKGGDC